MTDRLWAPWRVKYVTTLDKKSRGCIFCRMKGQKKDKENIYLRSFIHVYLHKYLLRAADIGAGKGRSPPAGASGPISDPIGS